MDDLKEAISRLLDKQFMVGDPYGIFIHWCGFDAARQYGVSTDDNIQHIEQWRRYFPTKDEAIEFFLEKSKEMEEEE